METPREIRRQLLFSRLEALKGDWEGSRLDSDPLLFPHRYRDPADREIAAFIAASLAFGRVASIKKSVESVLASLDENPAHSLVSRGVSVPEGPAGRLSLHRWVSRADMARVLSALSRTLRAEGSLEMLFDRGDDGQGDTVRALDHFFLVLRERLPQTNEGLTRGIKFLLPEPSRGGAAKRAHLFLRWVVRRDGLDLGLWRRARVTPARLLLPMDTHVHRICRYLGLTARRSADLAAVREVTAALRELRPGDPAAYDWSISRLGILAECVKELTRSHCERCRLEEVCQQSLLKVR
ncbi:MAG: TIGR02757 family protein [Thermoanaerobaculia bacterium]|nr:TIGR02757 family protein [Thermoanaerobaculia bacterium]